MNVHLPSLSPGNAEQLINSLVVPRPIAWVTSRDAKGIRNLAPFSYYMVVSRVPLLVMISFGGRKDTFANIEATLEFVINVPSEDLAVVMVASSFEYPPDVDEIARLGLQTVPSTSVGVPRLANVRAALECTLHSTQEIGDSLLAIGQVQWVYVADDVMRDGRVDVGLLRPVGRIGGPNYCTAEKRYRIDKPVAEQAP